MKLETIRVGPQNVNETNNDIQMIDEGIRDELRKCSKSTTSSLVRLDRN